MSLLSDLDPDVAYPATASVPDSDLHSLVRHLVYGALRSRFRGRGDCFVGQDLNVYYRFGEPRAVAAPDVFVCFGVDPGDLEFKTRYRVWDVGAPPAFVLEIASESTLTADLKEKPAKYLEMGVGEYWRFDPTGGEFYTPFLQGDRRAGGVWEAVPVGADGAGGLVGRSEVLGLDLHAAPRRLRLFDFLAGEWLPDPDETDRYGQEMRRQRDEMDRYGQEMRRDRDQMRGERDRMRRQRDAAEGRADAAEARADAALAELAALRARRNDRP